MLPAAQPCKIAVLDRNGKVAQRVARVLRAASDLAEVAVESDPATLRTLLDGQPRLLACDASDLDLALEWASSRYPDLAILTWTSGPMDPLLEAAERCPNLVGLVGWPSFASMPRPWELLVAARRVLRPELGAPRLGEIFPWGAAVTKFRPRTSAARDAVVSEIDELAARAGAPARVAQRVAEVAHELLMNAMYDAPRASDGTARYAHDRKQDLSLDEAETPTFRFATDGSYLALQSVDPFGALRRESVLAGIIRGRAAASGDGQVLDTSFGGAGLGLARIYAQSSVVFVDVAPGAYTSVTTFVDLDVNPREARGIPVSLHLSERAPVR